MLVVNKAKQVEYLVAQFLARRYGGSMSDDSTALVVVDEDGDEPAVADTRPAFSLSDVQEMDNPPEGVDKSKKPEPGTVNASGEIICGAKKPSKSEYCYLAAGFNTDHHGRGKCYLHGGSSTGGLALFTTGYRGLKEGTRRPLSEEIERKLHDPTLLSIDRAVAFYQIVVERQIEQFDESEQRYLNDFYRKSEQAAVNGDPLPDFDLGKIVNIELLDAYMRTVKTAYEMRFSKRFSIPITEFVTVLQMIAVAFNEIADIWKIPAPAKAAFAQRVTQIGVRFSPTKDEQLMRAGMGAEQRDAS